MTINPASSEPVAYYALAQNIKAGQTFSYGRGGKQWTALEDADTTNMRRRGNDLLVSIAVSCHGVVQSMPISVPLDKIIRLIPARVAA